MTVKEDYALLVPQCKCLKPAKYFVCARAVFQDDTTVSEWRCECGRHFSTVHAWRRVGEQWDWWPISKLGGDEISPPTPGPPAKARQRSPG